MLHISINNNNMRNTSTAISVHEGNRLIKVFMGLGDFIFFEMDSEFPYERDGTDTDLKYHSSFDWLMPVVEKIAEYGKWQLQPGFATLTLYRELGIGNKASRCDKKKFSSSEMDWERDDGEPVGWAFIIFSVVVQFIKWLNNTQTKQTHE